MLVSGGKIIAIDGVNTTSATLSGDGVFTPLGVNTNTIATTSFVHTEDNKIKNTLSSVSSTLNEKINTVSSDLSAEIDKKQIQLVFQGENSRITAIGPSGGEVSSVGGNVVDVKAGNSTTVTTAKDQQTGITTYTVSLTAQPTDTIVSGENGISSRQVENTFYVGLSSTYENAIKKVSSISADVTALSSNKLDSTAYKPETFYPKTGNPSGFLTQQSLNNYYNKTEVDNKFTATSSWANNTFLIENSANTLYQPKGNYLSSNALNDLSGNWQTTYTQVNTSSQYWNNAYDTISSISALKDIGNFKEIDVYKAGVQEPLRIIANGSADKLELKEVANINFITDPTDGSIRVSAKDTTYSQGQYIKISGETNEINVTGLQPAGNYVSSTEFETYKTSAANELAKKQDKSAMSAYAESAWVVQNFLPIDALDNVSGNWNSVYNTVCSNSANWDNITSINTFSSIGGVAAKNSADELLFEPGDNVSITTANNTITFSAKDTTYDENDFISASHFNNITSVSSNVTANSADWSSAARALEDSAANWNKTYEEFTESSTIWNDTTDAVQTNSSNWNSAYNAVTASADTWNSVTAVSSNLEELSGKVETLSGELETASATLTGQIDYLSGAIDNISDDIYYLNGAIDDKLDKDDFDTWSANADITPYTAGEGLALDDHQFYVSAKYVTSAGDSLSGKMLVLKDNKWEEMPDFGGFTTADGTGADYHPDVNEPSNKLIYLVKEKNLPPSSDNYKEWIYTLTETPQWECIGETTLDLTPYQLKLSAGDYISISGETNVISVTGLHNTIVTANNDTILITPTTALNGDVTYDLEVTYPAISGTNGISAGYVDDQYVVTLEDHLYSYAEAQTSETTLSTNPETITGFNNIKTFGDNISFVNDEIVLGPGLYHIDMQVYVPVAGGDNNYYNVKLIPSISNATLDQVVDGSFAHNDTLDLSFDVQLDSSNTLTFELNGLPPGYKYLVKNIQIHEVTTIDSVMQATGGTYRGGVATNIDNENKINVQYNTASGLAVDPVSNMLYVKLGEGLKFDTSGAAAGSLSLNNITQDVVQTVQDLKTELDGKLTTNFPYPMISNNNTDFATYKGNGDNCICQLFSVSLTHKITTDTYFTVYMKDSGYSQTNVIFGIFEYNFDYWDATEQRWRGQTNWVCDTGPVSLAKPTADTKLEFRVTHINPLHNELRSDRAYYAVLALKSDSGNGVFLACCDNYDGDVHSEPTLNWRWESVPNLDFVNTSGTLENTQWWDSGVNNYYEKADMRRFFLQIRNKVQPAPNP